MASVPPSELLRVVGDILVSLDTPEPMATIVAHSLVDANLAGHDSHGVIRLREYAEAVRSGALDPAARPVVRQPAPAIVTIDGRAGWGQVAMHEAVDRLIPIARRLGLAAATTRNCNHIGRLGEYAERIAGAGLACVIWCNGDPNMAPFGGRERMLGTNPFAAGIPVPGQEPVVADFATAAVAEGKLRVALAAGENAPAGAIVDRSGRPSRDPADFYDGGALVPFGDHKGYALSVVLELLGGGLSGGHPGISARHLGGNGVVTTVYDPAFYVAPGEFEQDMAEAVDRIRSSQPAESATEVLLPGDLESAARQRRRSAVPVGDRIWADVLRLQRELRAAGSGSTTIVKEELQ